jgi:hypothetical protein
MSRRDHLTCLRCGHEGFDVTAGLVRYDDPIDVTVQVPVSSRDGAITEPRQVPGVYGAEWRCTDRPACDLRLAELDALRIPPANDVDVAAFFAGVEVDG